MPAHAIVIEPVLTGAHFAHVEDDGSLRPATAEDPILKESTFGLTLDFTLPTGLQPGDTFGFEFPLYVMAPAVAPFTLVTDAGVVVGTCTTWRDVGVPAPSGVDCELTNAVVATWERIEPFHMFLRASATQETTEETISFTTTSGTVYSIPMPPGGIAPAAGTAYPTSPYKAGWTNQGLPGYMTWVVYMPATTAPSITITDTLDDGGLTHAPEFLRVYRTAEWNSADIYALPTITYTNEELDLAVSGDLSSFTLTFPTYPDEIPTGGAYWVMYETAVPEGTQRGTEFGNTVTGLQEVLTSTAVYTSDAGGTGGGSALPDLTITKRSLNEPEAVTYQFDVACTDPEDGRSLEFTAEAMTGASVTVRDIPLGSACTVTERDSHGADVTYSPAQTVVLSSPEGASMTVTNSFAAVDPETPVEPEIPVEPQTPAEPEGGGPAASVTPATLPATGGASSIASTIGVALALIAAGFVAVGSRRRTSRT
ncbi:hypothetical protein GCM10009796_06350 [Microbacterium koreense]